MPSCPEHQDPHVSPEGERGRARFGLHCDRLRDHPRCVLRFGASPGDNRHRAKRLGHHGGFPVRRVPNQCACPVTGAPASRER